MSGGASLVSPAEYARRRGVTRQAVYKAIRTGRLTAIDGKVDPAVADAQWDANTDPVAQQRAAAWARIKAEAQAAQEAAQRHDPAPLVPVAPSTPIAPRAAASDAPPRSPQEPATLNEARARREQAMAQMAELDLAHKRGELVSAAEVERALAAKVLAVRESLDTLADRLSPLLAAEVDAAKVYAMLRTEIRQALSQLAAHSRGPGGMQ